MEYSMIIILLFQIVGGGFFTGRYSQTDGEVEPGSRFDPAKMQGQVRQ